jgi:LmbE family N-acetylglucosaminyl deacetylase
MKIVIFAPHPDDEIYGCGGSILKWIDDGHELHIIYVTDNRALITWGKKENQLIQEKAAPYIDLSEEKLGEIGLKEAREVAKNFGFLGTNVHLFKFHDQDAINQVDIGKNLAKQILIGTDRIVLPSNNNNHPDHQATHEMAKSAAIEMKLDNVEFFVYAIYNVLKIPMERQIKIKMVEYRDKLYELMKGYKTQLCLKDTSMGWQTLKRRRMERFGVFSLEDANKFYNF